MTDGTSTDYRKLVTGNIITTNTQFRVCVQLEMFGIAQKGQRYKTLVVFNKDCSLHGE